MFEPNRVAFTGTRKGLTTAQRLEIDRLVRSWRPDQVYHGDCIGGDFIFDSIVRSQKNLIRIDIHPCNLPLQRAMCVDNEVYPGRTVVHPEAPPLVRNRTMVDLAEVVIGCPGTEHEEMRSGTWATIRYAQKIKRAMVIIYPSGKIETSNTGGLKV